MKAGELQEVAGEYSSKSRHCPGNTAKGPVLVLKQDGFAVQLFRGTDADPAPLRGILVESTLIWEGFTAIGKIEKGKVRITDSSGCEFELRRR